MHNIYCHNMFVLHYFIHFSLYNILYFYHQCILCTSKDEVVLMDASCFKANIYRSSRNWYLGMDIYCCFMYIHTFHSLPYLLNLKSQSISIGCHGHDRMVVEFATTHAVSTYCHQRCEFESCSGKVYSIQHCVIKFVSDLRQVDGLLRFPQPIKLTATI